VTRGDTTYIGTADGIKVTGDDGKTWAVITDSAGATTAKDPVIGRIQSQYVLAIATGRRGELWASHLRGTTHAGDEVGLAHSIDGGRTWSEYVVPHVCDDCADRDRGRALVVDDADSLWMGTEVDVYRFPSWNEAKSGPPGCKLQECAYAMRADVQQLVLAPGLGVVSATSEGAVVYETGARTLACDERASFTTSVLPLAERAMLVGTPSGLRVVDPRSRVNNWAFSRDSVPCPQMLPDSSIPPKHTWFQRPIDLELQPFIDQTYRYGSTMGGYFQPHQGVEFNNPDGTPVYAIGDGVVVYSGPAEAGANTVAIRHDRKLNGQYVFSVYYHNTKLIAKVGDRVKTGDVIALVGNTGRATNDHLHLEVHVAPTTDSSKIVDAAVRYPPFNTNPELWIEPMPGTGLVAGQVWDSKGNPVQQARIYGLVKPEPQETPFSYIETYGPKNHEDPGYHEHFAIGDVPAGEYTLGVTIEGKKVYRRVRVEPGKLTWVEFRPEQRH
jgi:murein DD-endopeptidase MepM/ murein hydrolase activator NlpD